MPIKGAFTTDQITAFLDEPRDVIIVSCRDLLIGNRAMDSDYWFAKGIGIVKQRVRMGNFELKIWLREYQPDGKTSVKMPSAIDMDSRLPVPGVAPALVPPVVPPPLVPPPVLDPKKQTP